MPRSSMVMDDPDHPETPVGHVPSAQRKGPISVMSPFFPAKRVRSMTLCTAGLMVCVACRPSNVNEERSQPQAPSSQRAENNVGLDKLIRPGVSAEEVRRILGLPAATLYEHDHELWIYPMGLEWLEVSVDQGGRVLGASRVPMQVRLPTTREASRLERAPAPGSVRIRMHRSEPSYDSD